MTRSPPKLIAINHDDYAAKRVGELSDGRQFFLTTPFEPAIGRKAGCEYIACYIFDARGKLLEAKIDRLGPRRDVDEGAARELIEKRLKELGDFSFGRIEVAPFSVRRFDTEFGLVLREPEDEDDVWAVEAQPGNYMAFFEPWDSGDYDT